MVPSCCCICSLSAITSPPYCSCNRLAKPASACCKCAFISVPSALAGSATVAGWVASLFGPCLSSALGALGPWAGGVNARPYGYDVANGRTGAGACGICGAGEASRDESFPIWKNCVPWFTVCASVFMPCAGAFSCCSCVLSMVLAGAQAAAEAAKATGLPVRLVIDATGFLHDEEQRPEKTWRHLDRAKLAKAFDLNAIGPALVMKHFLPLLPRDGRVVFATLPPEESPTGREVVLASVYGWPGGASSPAARTATDALREWVLEQLGGAIGSWRAISTARPQCCTPSSGVLRLDSCGRLATSVGRPGAPRTRPRESPPSLMGCGAARRCGRCGAIPRWSACRTMGT